MTSRHELAIPLEEGDELAPGERREKYAPFEWAFLCVWAAVVVVTCAYLLGSHLLAMPRPAPVDRQLVAGMGAVRGVAGAAAAHRWIVVHALYADCPCSHRVLHSLLERRADPTALEQIVMVGGDPASDEELRARATSRGYRFESLTADRLQREYHIEAVPVLVIADPAGTVRYVGGYTERKQSAVIHDVETLGLLRADRPVVPLPVFGCAISRRLRSWVDPLGIR